MAAFSSTSPDWLPTRNSEEPQEGAPGAAAPEKGAKRRNATFELFSLDEARFHLHPHLARAWRRRGRELRVPAPGKNKRVGVCGAYNPVTGQLLSRVAPRIGAREVVAVLANLAARARRTGRLILVVLDNAQLHKGRLARRAWARYAAWVRPFWLPGYCPDLNDIERIWKREKERARAVRIVGPPGHERRRLVPEGIVGPDVILLGPPPLDQRPRCLERAPSAPRAGSARARRGAPRDPHSADLREKLPSMTPAVVRACGARGPR